MNETRTRTATPVIQYTSYGGTEYRASGSTCSNPTGQSYYKSWSGTFESLNETSTMTDVVTRDFRRISQKGGIVCSPMNKSSVVIRREACSVSYDKRAASALNNCGTPPNTWTRYDVGGSFSGTRNPEYYLGSSFLAAPAVDATAMINQAITEAWASITHSEVDGLVSLAEANKTISSFMQIARRMVKIGLRLRKGKLMELAKELSPKELSDRWMEGRYAIRPTVYDACGFAKAFVKWKESILPLRRTWRCNLSATDVASQSNILTYSGGTNGSGGRVYANKYSSRTVTVRAGVLTELEKVIEAQYFGLDRPFEMMWELVPYSFVVDWFLNIGKVIASWSPNYGLRTLASWCTTTDVVDQWITLASSDVGTWTHPYELVDSFTVTGGYLRKTSTNVARVINPDRPILPTWNVRLDAAKLLDLVIMAKKIFT